MAYLQPSEIRAAIINHVYQNYTETPVEYPNVQLKEVDKKNPFVSLSIRFTNGQGVIRDQGATTRHSGVVYIDIRVPVLTSDIRAFELADIITNLMQNRRLMTNGNKVVLEASELGRTITTDEYYLLPVSIPFRVS